MYFRAGLNSVWLDAYVFAKLWRKMVNQAGKVQGRVVDKENGLGI